MIQITLANVACGVLSAPDGSKVLTFEDPQSHITVAVALDEPSVDGLVGALRGSSLKIARNGSVPGDVLRGGGPPR